MTIRTSTIDESGQAPSSGGGGADVVQNLNNPRTDQALSTQGLVVELASYPTTAELNSAITEAMSGLNRLPSTSSDSASAVDTAALATGNVLTNDSDPDGGPLTIVSVKYADIVRSVGVSFSTSYGTFIIQANGSWTLTLSAAAKALTDAQQVTEVFQYAVSDQSGGTQVESLSVSITGTNSAPQVNPDSLSATAAAASQSGNVLSNDNDPEGSLLTVTNFTVDGVIGTFSAGSTATVPGFGTVQVNSNGTWTRTKGAESDAGTIVVRYLASDGDATATGVLSIVLTGNLSDVESNPVTTALTGTRTFDVGPDKTYTEVSAVPWATLVAGDVVNIYHRPTPYVCKFGLAAQGEANAPVIINGVTDASGNRPILDGAGATVSPGSMPGTADNIWAAGDEGFGLITVKRRPSRPTSENPRWITIQNLEIKGARSDATYTNSLSQVVAYGFSAGIWLQPSTDITIRNCVIHDNSQGIFTMSKVGGIGESCQRMRILYNRIYGNGVVGSGYEHGCYVQGYDAVIEGNYIGAGRPGAGGSTYKSRVGKEVIRYNWIESTARMLDLVQPEFTDAFVAYPDYGIDYVYGNVLVNDERIEGNAWRPIHYGADGSSGGGEWEDTGSAEPNHRKQLYFFSNTYYHRNNAVQADSFFMQLSWPQTICDAWSNVLIFRGANSQMSLLFTAGTLNLRGTNIIQSYGTLNDASASRGATVSSYAVNRLGTVINQDPLFVSEDYYDFALGAGSPGIDIFSSLPVGVPSSVGVDHAVVAEPVPRSNGIFMRALDIGATDLGAMERDPSAPPRVAPVVAQAAVLDINDTYTPGNTVSVADATWLYNPDTVVRQWQVNTGSSWADIAGETGTTLALTIDHVGQIRVKYTATNVVGSTVAYSDSHVVTSTAAAAVVQIASGYDAWPTTAQTCTATFSTPPQVGNTLVAFLMVGTSIGDNFGNAWTKRQDLNSGYGSRKHQLYTCVVTNTGADFAVTGSSNGQDVSSIVVYEVDGTYVTSSGDAQGAGGSDGSISVTATAANQRVIAGFSAGRSWGNDAPSVGAPWVTGATIALAQADPTQTVVHGVSSGAGATTVTATYTGQQYLTKIAVLIDA